jgi:hypothetical protein
VQRGTQERVRRVRDDREEECGEEEDACEERRLRMRVGQTPAEPVAEREEREREPDDIRPDGVRAAEVRGEEARRTDLGRERRDPGEEDGRGEATA